MRKLGIGDTGQNGSQAIDKYTDFDNLDKMFEFAEKIAKSDFSPLKKAPDIVNAILMGRELGIAPIVSIQNIYPINGRAVLGVHILKGLLLRAGVSYDIIEEYAPQYAYIDSNNVTYTSENVESNRDLFEIINPTTDPATFTKGKKQVLRSLVPTDYRTKIKFKRVTENGTLEITRSKLRSDYNHLNNKDNWKNSPKDMLLARVMGVGSRDIAADIVGGIMLPDEVESSFSPEREQHPTRVVEVNDSQFTIMDTKVNEEVRTQPNLNVEIPKEEKDYVIQDAVVESINIKDQLQETTPKEINN